MSKGILFGIAAYALWGLFPIYWKALQSVPSSEILCHRMIWSLLFLLIVLTYRDGWSQLLSRLKSRRTVLTSVVSACLLSVNWLTFIWSVNSGYVVEASLGYFINPLVSVLLGVMFLRERPRPWQWVAIAIATIGVLYLTFGYGSFPWRALTLAFSFGLYGLFRKTAALSSLEGLSFEMVIMFLPALVYLSFLEYEGVAAFGHAGLSMNVLLAFSGVTTALPLLLFGSAAKRITLTNLGLLQYIAPTSHFLLGVLLYGEELTSVRATGFAIVWASLVIYSVEGATARRRRVRQAAPFHA
ncbi:MAG: EamA family transporter RarD [Candidatus Eiseniibacteriota bacterium]|nr:MAG: EamA family transporter RarD [Candidatus Eisenbacteria bacterium]